MERYETYVAKPAHIYGLCVPLILVGAGGMGLGESYFWPGLILFILGVAVGVWVVYTGVLQSHGEWMERKAYNLRSIREDMTIMNKVKDPNVWAVLGYEMPVPQQAQIEEPPLEHSPGMLPKITFPTPPVSDPKVKLFANGILMGASLSESQWSGEGKPFGNPEFRKFKKWLEHPDRGYIVMLDPSNRAKGFTYTKKGLPFFLYYADEGVRRLFDRREALGIRTKELPPDQGALERGGI
jgi:hypothetical protein